MIAALAASLGLVTFDTLAARVPVVLEKLSEVVGQKLECDSSFTNEVVVVHVKGVEPKELLDKFAFANVAKWVKRDGKFVLVPDAKRRAEQENELEAKRVRSIQRILDRFKEELAQPFTNERIERAIADYKPLGHIVNVHEQARVAPTERLSPISRLGMKALVSMGPEKLSAIKDGARLVFAAEPTSRQIRWANYDKLFDAFHKEWAMYNEVASAVAGSEKTLRLAWSTTYNSDLNPRTMPRVGTAWMSISDVLSTRTQNPVLIGLTSSDASLSIGQGVNFHIPPEPVVAPDLNHIPVTQLSFDPLTQELGLLRRGVYDNQHLRASVLKIADSLGSVLTDPVGHDPLRFASELYGQYADARGANLISVINDGAYERFLMNLPAPTPREFHRRIIAGTVFSEADKWVILTPSSPVEARRNRDDRRAIRDLLSSLKQEAPKRLKARSKYALLRPYGFLNGLGLKVAQPLEFVPLPYSPDEDEDLQRLYGTLTSEQQRDLQKGDPLEIGGLRTHQKLLLDRMLFGERLYVSNIEFGQPSQFGGEEYIMGLWSKDITSMLPLGIPERTPLTLSSNSESDLMLHNSQQEIGYSFSNSQGARALSSVARNLFFDRHPELSVNRDTHRADLFTAMDRFVVSLRLRFNDKLVWNGRLLCETPLTKRVKLAELPKEHQQAIAKEVVRFEEMLKNGVKFGSGPPNAPPKKQPPPH